MAALRAAAARPGRQCLFRLPLHQGPSLHRHIWTPVSQSAEYIAAAHFHRIYRGVDWPCSLAHSMMEALHYTGANWAIAIPLAAVIVRCGIVLPFISIPARKVQQRLILITPVVMAWKSTIRRHTLGNAQDMYQLAMGNQMDNLHKEIRNTLYLRWRCQWYRRLLPLLSMPIFLTMAETIRRMVGAQPGLLGLLFGDNVKAVKTALDTATSLNSSGGEGVHESPTATTAIQQGSTSAASADALTESANTTTTDTIANAASTIAPDTFTEPIAITAQTLQEAATSLQASFTINILQNHPLDWSAPLAARQAYLSTYLDPSLTTEGAFWFTDLTAADPTLILPLAVSGVTFLHVAYSSFVAAGPKISKYADILSRSLLVLSMGLWALIANVPSGILLYWAASTTAALANSIYLDWKLPLGKLITPAKRALPPFKRTKELPQIRMAPWIE